MKSVDMRFAEGVEAGLQMEYLRRRGCDEIQRYRFSRPLTPERFIAFVTELSALPSPALSH